MSTFLELPDLASRSLGGGVVAANDEFFAPRDALIEPSPAVFEARTFGAKGQVYDGWETRRRREPGHDHAIVRLGVPGVVYGVVIDTAHFVGNYPPFASVEGCFVDGYPAPDELAKADWTTVLPRSPLRGDHRNEFTVDGSPCLSHVRLSIFPDGGVARFRVHGEPRPDPRFMVGGLVDLAATVHGGRVLDCSDKFYGNPSNLLLPGLAQVMGDGWETRRRRDEGHDWVVVRLAGPGRPRVAELDTTHFKGNAPGEAALRGATSYPTADWIDLLPRTRLQPDTPHRFLLPDGLPAVSHVRLDIYPDGGMARLRLLGELT